MCRRTINLSIMLAAFAAILSTFAAADTGAITEHPIPTDVSQPVSIVTGPDGALWFTEFGGNNVGRVTTEGIFSEYAIPTATSRPDEIAAGPDGNLWFTETIANKIARITPLGNITEFGGLASGSAPTGVTAGPDGNVWFTQRFVIGRTATAPTGKIGRVTPDGAITEYSAGISGHPVTIAAGPDGNLWFTESPGNRVGRIDPTSGVVTEFMVPTFQSAPWEITAGPDGELWFTEINANQIGRISVGGDVTEFRVPTPASQPNTIRPGPDTNPDATCAFQREVLGERVFADRYGNFGGCVSRFAITRTLWFSEQNANRLAQITTNGDVVEFVLPGAGAQPGGLTEGPDGAVWFAELAGNAIGRLDVKSAGGPALPVISTP